MEGRLDVKGGKVRDGSHSLRMLDDAVTGLWIEAERIGGEVVELPGLP